MLISVTGDRVDHALVQSILQVLIAEQGAVLFARAILGCAGRQSGSWHGLWDLGAVGAAGGVKWYLRDSVG